MIENMFWWQVYENTKSGRARRTAEEDVTISTLPGGHEAGTAPVEGHGSKMPSLSESLKMAKQMIITVMAAERGEEHTQ